MLDKTRGIVLKSHKYSETSLITKVFTEKYGVLSFMVQGIRSSKNRKGNILQTGQLLDIDLYYRENKNFQRFKEYKASYIPLQTFTDIKKSSVQSFLMELSIQLVKEGEENEALFNHLADSLVEIDQIDLGGLYPIDQLLKISKLLGFHPANNYHSDRPYFSLINGSFQPEKEYSGAPIDRHQSHLIHDYITGNRNFSASEKNGLLQIWLLYFQHHIPNFRALKSIDILGELIRS